MRTDALVGIPNINQYISAFIIFVNTLTMIMTPFLVSMVALPTIPCRCVCYSVISNLFELFPPSDFL